MKRPVLPAQNKTDSDAMFTTVAEIHINLQQVYCIKQLAV
jgi:hypothetical protein